MNIKKILGIGLVGAVLTGCSQVPPGNEGVLVNNYGSDKGVQDNVVGVGYYFTGFGKTLYLFPTFLQNYTWTKDNNEDISIQTSEGLTISADVGITYQIPDDQVANVFQKYRTGVDEITNTFIRNEVRDAMNQVASTMTVEQIAGSGKETFIEQVNTIVKQEAATNGINVDKIYLIGSFRLPETVIDSINAKIQASQNALTAQNQIATAQAEAQKTIIEAQAQAQANHIISASITPELVEYRYIQKWNGQMPQVTGGPSLLTLPSVSLKGTTK